ncbi:MAG TPA: ATP-binding cassette domain-containing protein, partial [Spirochaetia bacterium]|nr:ATP-binding cassette domain-containing protein [Spirochaetia bacterium]
MIELRNLWVSFGPRTVLEGVDLDVADRLTTVILGRSGIGKSVLLKAVLGLVPLKAGSISIDGQDLLSLAPRPRAALRSRIGMLLQNG